MRNDRGRRDVRGRAERGGPGGDAHAVSSWRSASSWLMNTSVSSCVMNTCPCEGLPGTGRSGPKGPQAVTAERAWAPQPPDPCVPGNGPQPWRQSRDWPLAPAVCRGPHCRDCPTTLLSGPGHSALNYPLRGPSAPHSVSHDHWAGGSQ